SLGTRLELEHREQGFLVRLTLNLQPQEGEKGVLDGNLIQVSKGDICASFSIAARRGDICSLTQQFNEAFADEGYQGIRKLLTSLTLRSHDFEFKQLSLPPELPTGTVTRDGPVEPITFLPAEEVRAPHPLRAYKLDLAHLPPRLEELTSLIVSNSMEIFEDCQKLFNYSVYLEALENNADEVEDYHSLLAVTSVDEGNCLEITLSSLAATSFLAKIDLEYADKSDKVFVNAIHIVPVENISHLVAPIEKRFRPYSTDGFVLAHQDGPLEELLEHLHFINMDQAASPQQKRSSFAELFANFGVD
ncbi:MAG: hypothetical protein KDD62_09915, partial [Bdellovibrionales bacterium]|nr:hypothetical protein [Bdellovibrionales bacterium]